MAVRTYDLVLDTKETVVPEPIYVRQSDGTGAVVLHVSVVDRGRPVTLSGSLQFKAMTADNQNVISDNSNFKDIDLVNGKFTYELPNQVTMVPGRVKLAYFQVKQTTGEQSLLNITIDVKPSADIDPKKATDYIAIIESWGKILAEIDPNGAILKELVAARGNHHELVGREDAQDAVIAAVNSNLANKADKDYINNYLSQISYSPETVASLAELNAKYPNGRPGLFVTADNGHKYIWTDGAWKDAGVYQSQGVADKSIGNKYLADETASSFGFQPSGDGLPNYDTKTRILDFNCKKDRAYIKYNGHLFTFPNNLVAINNVTESSTALILLDITNKTVTFEKYTDSIDGKLLLGVLKKDGLNNINIYGNMPTTIDGKALTGNVISSNFQMLPSANSLPDYDIDNKTFDYMVKEEGGAIIFGTNFYQNVPVGLVALPSEKAATTKTSAYYVSYDIRNKTSLVNTWDEPLPPYSFVLATIRINDNGRDPTISAPFEVTINGAEIANTKGNLVFVPSGDGLPIYNEADNSFDFSCYKDRAYVVRNGQYYQLPLGANAVADGTIGSTGKLVMNLSAKTLRVINWNSTPESGEVVITAFKKDALHRVIFSNGFRAQSIQHQPLNEVAINAKNANILGIAHRGYRYIAPESTKIAYQMAMQAGYFNLEGDLLFTKDGIGVISHDDNIGLNARNDDGTIVDHDVVISETNLVDLLEFDMGLYKGNQYKGARLLTFEEFVKIGMRYNARLHIELKADAYTDEQRQWIVSILDKYNAHELIWWQSFNWDNLTEILKLHNYNVELLASEQNVIDEMFISSVKKFEDGKRKVYVSMSSNAPDDYFVTLRNNKINALVWIINKGEDARKYADLGVSGILTDGNVNIAKELKI